MLLRFIASLIAAAVFGLALDADAQAARNYDPAAEVTIAGTVSGVIGMPDAEGTVGLHLNVRTAAGVVAVHLGPAMFVGMSNFSFFVDDEVRVVGTRVRGAEPSIVARTITRAGRTLTLRDETGAPAWTSGADGADGCGASHAVALAGSGE